MTALGLDRQGRDPRLDLSPDALDAASVRAAPQVGKASGGVDLGMVAGGAGALALGVFTLVMMSATKAEPRAPVEPPPPQSPQAVTPIVRAPIAPPSVIPLASSMPANTVDPNQSRAQALIIDNTDGLAPPGPARPAPVGDAKPAGAALSADEQFALRVGGDNGPARSESLGDPTHTVVQGTMIPAVLETALNSDLPGYARAIVSRDVRGFDGGSVVIPRGSRLIGQYKSGLSSGQSRAFVVWTRLIRPDGVSIALGSPVMDQSGQTGLDGKVDRHFLQRFGGAVLLSVVSALPSALIGGSSTALVINSGSDATGAAAQALQSDTRIAPTIRVPLGTPIQVFAARDLVFGDR